MSSKFEGNIMLFSSDEVIAALIGAAISSIIGFFIFLYNHQRNKLIFYMQVWSEVQENNRLGLTKDENLTAFEQIVYGKNIMSVDLSRMFFLAFLQINRIQHLWMGIKYNLIGKKAGIEAIDLTIRLLKGQPDLIRYLILNRGYSKEFSEFFLERFEKVEPISLPPAEVIKIQQNIT